MKKPIAATKKFVSKHRVGIAVLATATVTTVGTLALNRVALQQHNDFLKAHDLYDAFYALNEV